VNIPRPEKEPPARTPPAASFHAKREGRESNQPERCQPEPERAGTPKLKSPGCGGHISVHLATRLPAAAVGRQGSGVRGHVLGVLVLFVLPDLQIFARRKAFFFRVFRVFRGLSTKHTKDTKGRLCSSVSICGSFFSPLKYRRSGFCGPRRRRPG